MFYIGILVLGVVSLGKLSVNLLPDLSYPKITVVTHYPGSGPEEIERFITNVLEGPLSSISGMKNIDSISREGISIITLEFHWGTDMDFALLHTKEQMEGVTQLLPKDCDPPVIYELDPSASPIMTVILKSTKRDLKSQKETAEYIIKPRLEQLDGISRVEIRGGDEEEVSVEIDPEKIKNLGISLSDVSYAIENANFFQAGGTVKKDKLRYTLKIEGEVHSPEDINNISIANLGGRNIQVKDIGKAFYKNKVRQGNIRLNTTSAISLLVYRSSNGNTVKATQDVQKVMDSLTKEFNNEVQFHVVTMEAELIIFSINSLTDALIQGTILSTLILLLFMQNWRDPLLVSVVVPISIVSTFALQFIFNVHMNIMSLGGLVLGVGIFVDNSIIVLEAIFRHRDFYKEDLVTAVINGTKEVGSAITASTFTTISIFLPVIYLYGITGKLFRDQALTVTFSVLSSLVVAVTLLPALAAFKAFYKTDYSDDDVKADSKEKKPFLKTLESMHSLVMIPFKIGGYVLYYIFGAFYLGLVYLFKALRFLADLILKPSYMAFNRIYPKFERSYQNLLIKFLNRKRMALYIGIFVVVGMVVFFSMLKKELLPSPNSGKFEIKATTPAIYGFEQTDIIASEIEKQLLAIKGVDYVFTESGAVSTFSATTEDISVNTIHFIVTCSSPKIRPWVMGEARKVLQISELTEFTTYLEKNTLSQYLSTSGENFQIRVFYEDILKGKQAVDMILNEVKNIPQVHDIVTTTTPGKPLFAVVFKQNVLDKFNIPKRAVAEFVNQAVKGQKAGTLKQIQKNYDIFVRVPVEGIMDVQKLLDMPVTLNDTTFFLKDLVTLKELPSIKMIAREAQERFFLISGDARNVQLDKLIAKTEAELDKLKLPENTRFAFTGEEEERRKAFDSLSEAMLLAMLLVFMIMAAEFENLMQPLIIMTCVPMGLVGAFMCLLISGDSLNIISGIGVMVLVGIGGNVAIVEVEYANQLRQEGMGIREAILTASQVRMRPILMTSLTTIVGVIPMGMMQAAGAELQKPLAYVIFGGLVFSTFLSLIFIPVMWEMLENYREKKRLKKEQKTLLFSANDAS